MAMAEQFKPTAFRLLLFEDKHFIAQMVPSWGAAANFANYQTHQSYSELSEHAKDENPSLHHVNQTKKEKKEDGRNIHTVNFHKHIS